MSNRRLSDAHLNACHANGRHAVAPAAHNGVSYATPTPERRARALNGVTPKPEANGGTSYQVRDEILVYKDHLSDDLVAVGAKFVADVQSLDASGVLLCSRSYTGMPFAKNQFDLTSRQASAAGFVRWLNANVDERFLSAAAWLILNIRPGSQHALDWAARTSKYKAEETRHAWTASALKMTLVRISEAYAQYAAHLRMKKLATSSGACRCHAS